MKRTELKKIIKEQIKSILKEDNKNTDWDKEYEKKNKLSEEEEAYFKEHKSEIVAMAKDDILSSLKELIADHKEKYNKSKNISENIEYSQYDIEEIYKSYIEAAFWAEEEDDEFYDYAISDIDQKSKANSIKEIKSFLEKAQKYPEELAKYDNGALGHNIWLSRNGHGAGFFDDNADNLQDIAREMKSKHIYVGDDKKVHID